MIELNNVSFKYKSGKVAIDNLNLKINDGEFVAIIGKNGSGKSTLGRLISGLEKPTNGSIVVNNIDTKNKKMALELRKNIGIVFQNPENQIIFNRVYDDILFGVKNIGIDLKTAESKIKESLEMVNMSEYINHDSYELSLGQKQRIAIASVLAMNTNTIIFDEPTTMLDPRGKMAIYEIVKNLKKQGYTIIYITNAIDEILLADRIVVIDDGILKEEFLTKDILKNINTLEKLNIKLPVIIQILEELKKNNINIELKEFTTEEFVQELVKNCKEKK